VTFKVFVSGSIRETEIIGELIETLGRYGIQSTIPGEFSNDIAFPVTGVPTANLVEHQIQNSDCVLFIITKDGMRADAVNLELGIARALNRVIVPIVEEGAKLPANLANVPYISIDRNQPKLGYERAAEYLSKLKTEKENKNTIGGLVLLGLGLLFLGLLASSD